MERYLFTEIVIPELLIVGTFLAVAIQQLNFPYTVALVLAGLAMMRSQRIEVDLRPDVVLALSIPPLLFGAARRINLPGPRKSPGPGASRCHPDNLNRRGALTLFTPLALPAAFVFVALVSTTDPFSVGALLRNPGVSNRLAALINSESLLNNVTAMAVFNLAMVTVLTGQFQFLNNLGDFIRVWMGGMAVGLVLGWSISRLVQWGNDQLIETVLTALLPFVSYLLAERLHVSGALAVVAAGLINGTLRAESTSSRPWEFLAFVANPLIFLLMGLQVSLSALLDTSQAVLWAILAVIVARGLVAYGLNGLMPHNADRIPMDWLHVWNWSGLRGAIGMALVLSLPRSSTSMVSF